MIRECWPEPSPSGSWREVYHLLHAQRGVGHE